ncbi:hypothetical protein [Roseivirga sp.]|uniref:hypothetical protein n=1 Tax=Roseivirga sp. TaxID=1964215 RepID=UPI003B518CE7
MKKLKVFVAFGALIFLMSSCVYSLFPIYTEDSKLYLPELEGKWSLDEDSDSYLVFRGGIELDGQVSYTKGTPLEKKGDEKEKPKVETSFSIEFDDDEFIVVEGDTIRDREKIQAYYDKELASISSEFADRMGEALVNISNALNGVGRNGAFDFGTSKDSYLLTWVDGKQRQTYEAILTDIGGDLFLDLYAADGEMAERNVASEVWFPVHTFMKVDLQGDKLRLIQFDHEKMKRLFESNLVRLRHENVDGSILLTAQTNELRKFIDKYSDDETVFEEAILYSRIEE